MKKVVLISIILVFGMVSGAWASSIEFELGHEFSGGQEPVGGLPWVTATFDDNNTPGSVQLTITNVGLVNSEYMSEFCFNYDPAITDSDSSDIASLSFSYAPTPLSPVSSVLAVYDFYQADGDGKFDVKIDFSTSEENRFGAEDTVVIDITGTGIEADSFDALSLGAGNSKDGLPVAAHIQSIDHPEIEGIDTEGSGWITDGGGGGGGAVPIPAAVWLFGSGLVGVAGMVRRKK